jgi:hypothetical protein
MNDRLVNIERTEAAMHTLAAEDQNFADRAARRSNIDARLLPEGAKELGSIEALLRNSGRTKVRFRDKS